MMLIGIIWAIFAPVSLFVIAWMLYQAALVLKLSDRFGLTGHQAKIFLYGGSLLIVVAIVTSFWIPERLEFQKICQELGTPVILKTESASGFFLDDPTANSFGMRYLREDGFSWIEAKSIYNRDKFTRYEMIQGKIEQHEIDQISAKYVVKSESQMNGATDIKQTTISKIDSGEKLAWANSLYFDGGQMKWVMGAWGSSTCPNPLTNADGFNKMYRLAKETLVPAQSQPQ